MTITGVGNYGNVYESIYDFHKKETDVSGQKRVNETSGIKTEAERKNEAGRAGNAKTERSSRKYLSKLQGKVSVVTLETGYGLNTKRDNKIGTITINPKLLEKMQRDPEAEKKYTQLLKDIERAEKTVTAYYNGLGGCVERSSHWYIDENGKYCHFGYVRRDDKLNKKLREETQKNAERQIEKCRENNRMNAERLVREQTTDYYSYLSKKYDCVRNGNVTISASYLKQCEKDPDKAKELEQNLDFYKESYRSGCESAKTNARALGARLVDYTESWSIDSTGNVAMQTSTTVTSDTKGWKELKEEQEERLKEKREKEKQEEIIKEKTEKKKEQLKAASYPKFNVSV